MFRVFSVLFLFLWGKITSTWNIRNFSVAERILFRFKSFFYSSLYFFSFYSFYFSLFTLFFFFLLFFLFLFYLYFSLFRFFSLLFMFDISFLFSDISLHVKKINIRRKNILQMGKKCDKRKFFYEKYQNLNKTIRTLVNLYENWFDIVYICHTQNYTIFPTVFSNFSTIRKFSPFCCIFHENCKILFTSIYFFSFFHSNF